MLPYVYTAVCGVRSRDDALTDARAALGTLQKLLARKEREVLDHERRLPARLRLADDEIVNLRTPGPAARRPAPGGSGGGGSMTPDSGDALFERVRRLPGSAVSALRPLVAEAEHVRGKLIEFATPQKGPQKYSQ